MSEFKWASGSHISEKTIGAQAVGDNLEQLQEDNGGRLTARVVVDAARPIEAPLHPAFEWDDLKAAELHREHQARHILAAIRIVQPRTDPKQKPQMIHAYINIEEQVGDEKQRAYVPLARLFNEPDLLNQAIERAAAELRAFEDRYAAFDAIALAVRTAREQIETVAA